MDLELVDPDLRDATKRLPVPDVAKPSVRRIVRLATRLMPAKRLPDVRIERIRRDGVDLRVHRPLEPRSSAALLWVHGGGYVIGSAKQDDPLCSGTASALGIPVLSVEYRLAPEHRFPAAHQDVLAAWRWLQLHAAELDIDPFRVAIGGESAGGGIAAGLVQRLRDEDGPQPIAQWLFAPMLDDRTAADDSLDAAGHWIWTNAANRVGWTALLGHEPGRARVEPYAVPARRDSLAGLPPTWIGVGDIELFHDEDVAYARRLAAAGVPVELDVVPGAPHGFENWANEAEPSKAVLARARHWLGQIIGE